MGQCMERAVQLAVENVAQGGSSFGAVLVQEGKIIAEGINELHSTFDGSSHAELNAIRHAQKTLQTNDLSNCTMYASGQPCPICLTSMYFVGVTDIYYSQSVDEATNIGLGASKAMYQDFTKPNESSGIVMQYMSLEEGQQNPMRLWVQKHEK